jgi:hypothetical protein
LVIDQFDHVHRRRAAALPARPAFQRGFELPHRGIPRPPDRIKGKAGERADRLVLDLDPGEGVQWDAVVEAALRMRGVMAAEGFSTWPKLTGGKGIHLMGPLADPLPHDEAHRIARRLVSVSPLSFQTNTSFRRKRGGAVASFSTTCAMTGARSRSTPW